MLTADTADAAPGAYLAGRKIPAHVTPHEAETIDQSSPIPLSCYIRTLNESRTIANVVRAAFTVASEVVVIDAGSTDDTVALAEAAGARVLNNSWPGNGFQKRLGEEACLNDWLLDIDGDEVITPELARGIAELFKNGEPRESVYDIKMIHAPPVGEPWWTFGHTWRRKLYDRREHRMPAHKMWDQLDLPLGAKVPQVQGSILHYAFRDISHVVAKRNRGSSARAANCTRRSKAELILRVWMALPFYFVRQYIARGQWRAGTYGLIFSLNGAYGRWLRDAKMFEQLRIEEEAQRSAAPSRRQSALDDPKTEGMCMSGSDRR